MTIIPLPEQSKYAAILRLAMQQVAALEANDEAALLAALHAKGKLIASLDKAPDSARADASLATLVESIRQIERRSEAIMRGRLSQIQAELVALRSRGSARLAYRSQPDTAARALAPAAVLPGTPRLFDLHS